MWRVLFFLFFFTACASPQRDPEVTAPPGALELSQALKQGLAPTLTYLRSQTNLPGYEGLEGKDPTQGLPDTLKAIRAEPPAAEKIQRQNFLRKFRAWKLNKKMQHGLALLENFSCQKALEVQALGLSLELDFPEPEASQASQDLHAKALSCSEISRNESLFRLTVFSIQRGDCAKAQEYLEAFSLSSERGIHERVAYLHSLCATKPKIPSRNPWGGYGILLHGDSLDERKFEGPTWYLTASSGAPEWDRLLVSFIELSEKGKTNALRFIAGKLNYEKFRALPLPFQTSVLVILSLNGADLPVFQTLHRYLAENPNMISPSVTGLLFPVRYWREIKENSVSVDPVLVTALIRQESAFNPLAHSPAHAVGLMQLIYPTARAFGIKKTRALYEPGPNIQAGSEFLARLISDFGSVELALAAYNAGPGIVREWQRRYPTNNINLFVEMIPFSETREYVRLVTRNYKIYQSLLSKTENRDDLL